jgi:arabinofuranan 3-O-arabinosyltransferase
VIVTPRLHLRRLRPPPSTPARRKRLYRTVRLFASRQTTRLAAFCLLIGMLPFLTAPGNLIADTKLDLAVDPGRFLARALTLWDPQQFGQLQDQAAGYLFPMGPFFALGRLAGLEPWVIQRLWIGAVGVAAFLGTVRLAGRLRIGTPWTQVAAGLAYAASPAALTLMGQLSAEFLPAAMLPWILIPLVDAGHGGGHARAAARSAVAAALCGGVNATVTTAVLLPAVVYVVTLARPAPRWRILLWWVPAVVAATWWWSVPLLLMSRYGVSIIPYTESAAVTTSVTSLSNTLRGTENWVAYLVVNGQPWWQVGYRIATGAVPTLLTGLAAGLGLAGLISPRLPARRFLLCVLLAGVVIVTAGYVSGLGNPLAGPVDHLINGPAFAFRNVRRFDPMIRLPVVLGLAHLLASVRLPRLRSVLAWTATLAIGGLALPAYATGLPALAAGQPTYATGLAGVGDFRQLPSYWVSAADWLNRHAGHQVVLVVPGAAFGQYLWGSPLDDVLQPLATVDWAGRSLSAVGSPGNARLLDAIDQRMAAGDGSAGLTQVLARMGVKYVLVRNDLIRSSLNGAWPARIHQALGTSPGISKVAQFGTLVGSFLPDDAATNFDAPYPPVEIYQVSGAAQAATVQPAAGTLRVYGGPEALLTLADEGLLGSRPVLLNSDSPGLPATAAVVTDSLRRRARNFGELRRSYSPTLTATEPAHTFAATDDYTEPGWSRYLSVAQYHGLANVTASSSASDVGAIPVQWASGLLPYSAVDGDPRTMWESGSWTGPIGQWIQLGFRSAVDPGVVWVSFADNATLGPAVTQVAVRTAAGQVTDRVQVTRRPQALRVPRGASGWLRITVTGLASLLKPGLGTQVGIWGISVPGVQASRTIVAPRLPAADSASLKQAPGGRGLVAVVLAKAQPQPSGCMRTSLRWVCSPSLVTPTEEQYGFDHAFTVPAAGRVTLRGSAVLVIPSLAQQFSRLSRREAHVWASSTYTADPQDQAMSAFDANPATTWISSTTDAHPTLTIAWHRRRTVNQVTIERPPGASGLLQVLISGSRGQVRGGMVGPTGTLRFAPMRTRSLTLRFTPLQTPLQITDVVIPGVAPVGAPSVPFRLPCGLGPAIRLNGKVLRTRVSGTFAALLTGRPVRFTACREAVIAAGANRVIEPASDAFDIQDVVLTGGGGQALSTTAASPAAPAVVRSWTPSRRVLEVIAVTRSYLVVNENFNPGWRASAGGRQLRAVRLDGWKQAWLLPAGTAGAVTLTYLPQTLYRDAIVGGLGALLLVMLVAVWPGALGRRLRVPVRWLGGSRGGAPDRASADRASADRAVPDAAADLGSDRVRAAAGRILAGRVSGCGDPGRCHRPVHGRDQQPVGAPVLARALPPLGADRAADGRGGLRCSWRKPAARWETRPARDRVLEHPSPGHLPGHHGQASGGTDPPRALMGGTANYVS